MSNDNNDENVLGYQKVTIKDVFRKINLNNDKLDAHSVSTNNKFDEVLLKLKETNGKVKLNRWIATTALTLITTLILALAIAAINIIFSAT